MILPLLLAVTLLAPPQAAPASPPPAAAPTAFESYQLVLLQRPEHPRDYPEAKLEEIQQAHLAHIRALAEAGKLLVAGPARAARVSFWRGAGVTWSFFGVDLVLERA